MVTPTDDNRDLLTVVAHMTAAPGKADDLRAELTALVEPTSKEDGFVNYDLHESLEAPGTFFLYENWTSAEKLDAHLGAPHALRFISLIPSLVDENGLVLNRLRRIA